MFELSRVLKITKNPDATDSSPGGGEVQGLLHNRGESPTSTPRELDPESIIPIPPDYQNDPFRSLVTCSANDDIDDPDDEITEPALAADLPITAPAGDVTGQKKHNYGDHVWHKDGDKTIKKSLKEFYSFATEEISCRMPEPRGKE